jgi:hypothetical protein
MAPVDMQTTTAARQGRASSPSATVRKSSENGPQDENLPTNPVQSAKDVTGEPQKAKIVAQPTKTKQALPKHRNFSAASMAKWFLSATLTTITVLGLAWYAPSFPSFSHYLKAVPLPSITLSAVPVPSTTHAAAAAVTLALLGAGFGVARKLVMRKRRAEGKAA